MLKKYILFVSVFIVLLTTGLMAESVVYEKEVLPQFDMSKYSQQIFWLIITFLSVYLFVSFKVVPKINKIKSYRSNLIVGNMEKSITVKKDIENIVGQITHTNISLHNELKAMQDSQKKELDDLSTKKSVELEDYKRNQLIELKAYLKNQEDFLDKNEESIMNNVVSIVIDKLNLPKNDKLQKNLITKFTGNKDV